MSHEWSGPPMLAASKAEKNSTGGESFDFFGTEIESATADIPASSGGGGGS